MTSSGYITVQGHLYGPETSRQYSGALAYVNGQLNLRNLDEDIIIAHGQPQTRELGPGGLTILTYENGWRFETRETEAVDALIGPAKSAMLHEWERFSPRLIYVVLAAFAGAYAIWRWGIDALVAVAIWATPPAAVDLIDKGNLASIDQVMTDETQLSADKQDEITEIFETVARFAPPAPYGEYELLFRDAPAIGANAFALPGGTIVITDDMVKDFGDPDLLAGIFGHEIAHVSEKHGLTQVYRSLSVYLLIALIAGDVGPVLEDVVLEGGVLLSLSYSRKNEREADSIGIEIARDAGFDPAALADFFDELAHDHGDGVMPQWYSTHPASEERADAIREQAAQGAGY